jgi:hypothetical protein
MKLPDSCPDCGSKRSTPDGYPWCVSCGRSFLNWTPQCYAVVSPHGLHTTTARSSLELAVGCAKTISDSRVVRLIDVIVLRRILATYVSWRDGRGPVKRMVTNDVALAEAIQAAWIALGEEPQ